MSTITTGRLPSGTHAEAYCSTGTSPGRVRYPDVDAGSIDVRLPLDCGARVDVRLRYEASGPVGAPPIVVLGGISASRHLCPNELDPTEGWWRGVVGDGRTLDPFRHRLVGIDFLGGSEVPVPSGVSITPLDQARALRLVLDHLGVRRVTLVGASYGGMVALDFAVAYPDRSERLALLCVAHRPHPLATAIRSVQRRILEISPDPEGVALARALAMTTYRTAEEFDRRFDHRRAGEPFSARSAAEGYVASRGAAFAGRFDAHSFAGLSESVDLQDVAPETLIVPTWLWSVDSDQLAPPWLVAELAARAPGVRAHRLDRSIFGHDAFLKEAGTVETFLDEALGAEVAR